jgi:DNA-binding transcriptional MerR regulator
MARKTKQDKLFFPLEEVSRLAKLDPKLIESWEQEFYFLNAGRTGTGKKIFRKKDLDIILRLKGMMESEGLTLAGAKRKIEMEFGLVSKTPVHPERLKKTLFQIRAQLKDIASDLDKL